MNVKLQNCISLDYEFLKMKALQSFKDSMSSLHRDEVKANEKINASSPLNKVAQPNQALNV